MIGGVHRAVGVVLNVVNVEDTHRARDLEILRERLSVDLEHLRTITVLVGGPGIAKHALRGAHLHAELLPLEFLVGGHVRDGS